MPKPSPQKPKEDLSIEVLKALLEKDFKKVQALHSVGADLYAENHLLLRSLFNDGEIEALSLILELGDYEEKFPEHALCGFAACGNIEAVKKLLKRPSLQDHSKKREIIDKAATICSRRDSSECLEAFLKENKPDLKETHNLLDNAIRYGAIRSSKTLTDYVMNSPNLAHSDLPRSIAWLCLWVCQTHPQVAKGVLPKLPLSALVETKEVCLKRAEMGKDSSTAKFVNVLEKEIKRRKFAPLERALEKQDPLTLE